ncbi:MAG: zinc ribbon domain-containing protein [Candidatus Heimdallarchaeota archaeon]|nr:zinc ribbon domain-containing protein [Candidatus Heimdallarchaeota archaeon]
MTFCPECGNKIQENHQFCNKCGADINLFEKKSIPSLEPQARAYQPSAPALVRRNYLIWWLLTYLVSPFAYLYLYYNFEDLNNLVQVRPPKEGPSLITDKNSVLMYIILSVFIPFFIIVVRYWKYDKFYKYLEYSGTKIQTMPISGKKQLAYSIMLFVFLLTGIALLYMLYIPFVLNTVWLIGLFIGLGAACVLASMGFSFYFIYTEYIWQKAMNEQVLMINPHAEEKTLF